MPGLIIPLVAEAAAAMPNAISERLNKSVFSEYLGITIAISSPSDSVAEGTEALARSCVGLKLFSGDLLSQMQFLLDRPDAVFRFLFGLWMP